MKDKFDRLESASPEILDMMQTLQRDYAAEASRRGYVLSVYTAYNNGLGIELKPKREADFVARAGFPSAVLEGTLLHLQGSQAGGKNIFHVQQAKAGMRQVLYDVDIVSEPYWYETRNEFWPPGEVFKKFNEIFNEGTRQRPLDRPGVLEKAWSAMRLPSLSKRGPFEDFHPDRDDEVSANTPANEM